MTGTFSRLEERKSTETFRKSNGGKRVHSALQMEKEKENGNKFYGP